MYSNGQTAGLTTQGATGPITGAAGTTPGAPGTAGMDAFNTYSSGNQYGSNFPGRHHLQTAAATGQDGQPVIPIDGASAGLSEPGLGGAVEPGGFGSRVRSMNQTNMTYNQNPLGSQYGTASTSVRGSNG